MSAPQPIIGSMSRSHLISVASLRWLPHGIAIAAYVCACIFVPLPVAAQQPAWRDIAMQAQTNAAVGQMTANAIIGALQAEIAELKAQLAKAPSAPPIEPPAAK